MESREEAISDSASIRPLSSSSSSRPVTTHPKTANHLIQMASYRALPRFSQCSSSCCAAVLCAMLVTHPT
eukprot:43773-Eustigmatos_ZCMA.PRE.1